MENLEVYISITFQITLFLVKISIHFFHSMNIQPINLFNLLLTKANWKYLTKDQIIHTLEIAKTIDEGTEQLIKAVTKVQAVSSKQSKHVTQHTYEQEK